MHTYLGVEFGSTRIKAVAIDENFRPVSTGGHTWASDFRDGVWTYDLEAAFAGLRDALRGIENRAHIQAMGVSGMMHGYLAFDRDWNLLVPFRTWQNTMTAQAARELSETFAFNVPQRWSIAHLYQAVLNREAHIDKIAHITTLAGYIHYKLTGVNAVGIGEASGIFPIDSEKLCYHREMMDKFERMVAPYELPWKLEDVLPQVLVAGQQAGCLTPEGAKLLEDLLPVGIPFAPAEGDAGTGMVATNAVAPGTGNISAGTSVFSMVVLEKTLSKAYPQIDVVTTPGGKDVAMVHCNNCTNDSNAWIATFREAGAMFGQQPDTGALYTGLYEKSMEADPDCGGVLVCNYMAGEPVTGLNAGVPLVVRKPGCKFTLANFLRSALWSAIASLQIGMQTLQEEGVQMAGLVGHGGYFKTPVVGQTYMAAACNTPITCMKTAGEGGPFGMALLAAYLFDKEKPLENFLNDRVFRDAEKVTVQPEPALAAGFASYIGDYKKLLQVEAQAVAVFKEETK